MDNLFYKNHHERRGCSQFYTDQVISTFLMLKGVFSPTLRATQELFDSLFELLLCAPDYSCASKGARMVEVADRKSFKGRITDLVIHSIGLKVFGEVEQKARKHDPEKRRVWHKLHLGVDPATHYIVAAEVSLENVRDAEVLPKLLNSQRRKLGHAYADGKASQQLTACKGAAACIPPRKDAGLWKNGHPRNETVLVVRKEGLAPKEKISGITVAHWKRRW